MRILKGKVATGIGDFSKRMEGIPGLLEAYERKTGIRFFPGTLNVQLLEEYSVPSDAIRFDKNDYEGTIPVYIIPCTIFGRKAFILRTELYENETRPRDTLEIACDVKLRDAYGLKDGDEIEVTL